MVIRLPGKRARIRNTSQDSMTKSSRSVMSYRFRNKVARQLRRQLPKCRRVRREITKRLLPRCRAWQTSSIAASKHISRSTWRQHSRQIRSVMRCQRAYFFITFPFGACASQPCQDPCDKPAAKTCGLDLCAHRMAFNAREEADILKGKQSVKKHKDPKVSS